LGLANSARHVSYQSCKALNSYNENQEMILDCQIISGVLLQLVSLLHNCIGDFHLQCYHYYFA